MFNSKFNGLLTVLLIIAIVGILALIGYFCWSVFNKYSIESDANKVVDSFEQMTSNKKPEEDGDRGQIGDVEDTNSIYTQVQTNSGAVTKYNGYEVWGTISIPKINIKYPILEKSTPSSIKIAVAYLSGVGINKVGNTVIQGHNYRNGLFFSNLKKLTNGDKIEITDTDGLKVTYEVYNVFETDSTDTSFYGRDTNGLREVTLSTCTDDGKKVTIVLAKEIK